MVRPLTVSAVGPSADAGRVEHDLVDAADAEVAFNARVRKGGRAKGCQAHPRRGQTEGLTDVPGFEQQEAISAGMIVTTCEPADLACEKDDRAGVAKPPLTTDVRIDTSLP